VTESDDEATMRQYLADIAQYTPISRDDERRLLQAIERGATARDELAGLGPDSSSSARGELHELIDEGREAQRTLTRSNLQLVVEIVKL
jgi:DNA-directed RNA polymerase sigma subunit (sigma70/sigma32)